MFVNNKEGYTQGPIYVTPQDIQKTCYTKTCNNNEHGEYVSVHHQNVCEYLRGIYTRTDLCHTSGYTKHLLHKNLKKKSSNYADACFV